MFHKLLEVPEQFLQVLIVSLECLHLSELYFFFFKETSPGGTYGAFRAALRDSGFWDGKWENGD